MSEISVLALEVRCAFLPWRDLMALGKSKKGASKADGFINVRVSRETRAGLHILKVAMGVAGQEEVIERLVRIGLAISIASR
jgi:hypothetical protein